jgi:hypothetical protein
MLGTMMFVFATTWSCRPGMLAGCCLPLFNSLWGRGVDAVINDCAECL